MSPRRRRPRPVEDLATSRRPSLAVADLALTWGVTEAAVRKWIAAGVLRAFRVGRAVRVRRREALRFEREL